MIFITSVLLFTSHVLIYCNIQLAQYYYCHHPLQTNWIETFKRVLDSNYSALLRLWWHDPIKILAEFYNRLCNNTCCQCQIIWWRSSSNISAIKKNYYVLLTSSIGHSVIVAHMNRNILQRELEVIRIFFLPVTMFHLCFAIATTLFEAVP